MKLFRLNYDMLGIGVSLICAIHCLLLPVLLNSLPLFGLNILQNEMFELLMILLAGGIGIYSLWHGFHKHHKSFIPYVIFVTGIALLILKQTLHPSSEWILLIPAVILIILAHILNFLFSLKIAGSCISVECKPAKKSA